MRAAFKAGIVGVVVLMFATPSSPQQANTYGQCINKAVSQSDANQCAVDESSRASAEHAAVLAQVLARTQYVGDDDLEKAKEKVRAMENAWVAYCDAFVEARFPGDDKTSQLRDALSANRVRVVC